MNNVPNIADLAVVPDSLKTFFPTVEELKSELGLAVDKLARSEVLLKEITAAMKADEYENEKVKAISDEVTDITIEMSLVLYKRFGECNPNDVHPGVDEFARMMALYHTGIQVEAGDFASYVKESNLSE